MVRKNGGPSGPQASASSNLPRTVHDSHLRRCSRVVDISLRNLSARMPVGEVCAHAGGFPFDAKD